MSEVQEKYDETCIKYAKRFVSAFIELCLNEEQTQLIGKLITEAMLEAYNNGCKLGHKLGYDICWEESKERENVIKNAANKAIDDIKKCVNSNEEIAKALSEINTQKLEIYNQPKTGFFQKLFKLKSL